MNRILVTGGAGFIGSHITDELLGPGPDRGLAGDPENDARGRVGSRIARSHVGLRIARGGQDAACRSFTVLIAMLVDPLRGGS